MSRDDHHEPTGHKKRVVVCGSGIMGLATCYYLLQKKHEHYDIVCLDRSPGPAQGGASWKNGAFLDPALYSSWADLKLLTQTLVHSNARGGSVIDTRALIRAPALFLGWASRFLWSSRPTANRHNSRKIRNLGFYSMVQYATFNDEDVHEIIDERRRGHARGSIELFPRASDLTEALVSDRMTHVMSCGFPLLYLKQEEVHSRMPMLRMSLCESLTSSGALFSPTGRNGDVHQTSLALHRACQDQGVKFYYHRDITSLVLNGEGSKVQTVMTSSGEQYDADIVVLACGSDTQPLAQEQLQLRLWMIPLTGYILTVPLSPEYQNSWRYNLYAGGKVLLSPWGSHHVRISGGVDVIDSESTTASSNERAEWVLQQAQDILAPDVLEVAQAEFHTCIRSVSADDVPFIGRTTISNCFVNTGHGSKGWTLAFGSGAFLADLIAGDEPALPEMDYSPLRSWFF